MVSKSNEFRSDQTHQRFSYLKTVTRVVIRPSMVTQNKTWRFSKRVKKDNYNVWRNSTFGSTSTRRSKKSCLILFPLLIRHDFLLRRVKVPSVNAAYVTLDIAHQTVPNTLYLFSIFLFLNRLFFKMGRVLENLSSKSHGAKSTKHSEQGLLKRTIAT